MSIEKDKLFILFSWKENFTKSLQICSELYQRFPVWESKFIYPAFIFNFITLKHMTSYCKWKIGFIAHAFRSYWVLLFCYLKIVQKNKMKCKCYVTSELWFINPSIWEGAFLSPRIIIKIYFLIMKQSKIYFKWKELINF